MSKISKKNFENVISKKKLNAAKLVWIVDILHGLINLIQINFSMGKYYPIRKECLFFYTVKLKIEEIIIGKILGLTSLK